MKKNILGLVALVALGLFVWLISKEDPKKEEDRVIEKLPFPIATTGIDSLEILRHEGSGSTLREEHIKIKKIDGIWQITAPVKYRAHKELIELMFDAMKEIKVIDMITDNPKKHRALELDDEFGVVVTASSGGERVVQFIVGVTQKDITFVRMPGSDKVYRTTGAFRNRFNKPVNKLRHKLIFDLDEKSVSKMTFSNDNGELELVRRDEVGEIAFEPQHIKIKNFDNRRAVNAAMSIPNLVARDFEDQELGEDVTGIGEGAAMIEFEATKDGHAKTYKMWLGNEVQRVRQTYLTTSESDQLFLVSSHVLTRFRLGADDFARTDKEIEELREAERKAAEHAEHHHGHSHGGHHGHSHGGDHSQSAEQ